MKKLDSLFRKVTNDVLAGLLSLSGLLSVVFVSCEKGADDFLEEPPVNLDYEFHIEGITPDNYPNVDASTTAAPLQTLIACKLLGINYSWAGSTIDETYSIDPQRNEIPDGFDFYERIKTSKTHDAILNIIDKKADFIFSARKMSDDEKKHAVEMGVTLIETPIALDAFIFIVNPANPIRNLTTKQIQDIYTGKITNWKNVGGFKRNIEPLVRNQYSGSQELMETLVMKDLQMKKWPVSFIMTGMMFAIRSVSDNPTRICYSLFYYNEQMIQESLVKTIAVDGVYPTKKTIKERQYPYVAELYAVIRSDLDKSSMAYKLYELLQTENAKFLITEGGYIPN